MPEATVRKTRPLSLRAPITTEEERVTFQRRLALSSLVVFALAITFYVVQMIAVAASTPKDLAEFTTSPIGLIQLGTTVVAGVAWLMTRGEACTAGSLSAFDTILWVGMCIGWTVMAGK